MDDEDDPFASIDEIEDEQFEQARRTGLEKSTIRPTRRGRGRPPLYAPGEHPKSWAVPPSPREAMQAFKDLEGGRYYSFSDLYQQYVKYSLKRGTEVCGKSAFGTVLNQARVVSRRKKVDGRMTMMRYLADRFHDAGGTNTWAERPVNSKGAPA